MNASRLLFPNNELPKTMVLRDRDCFCDRSERRVPPYTFMSAQMSRSGKVQELVLPFLSVKGRNWKL